MKREYVKNSKLYIDWDDAKNELDPSKISVWSKEKVWWKCSCGHSWMARVDNRYGGYGCPYCENKIVSLENCLGNLFPELVLEWSFENKCSPYDVLPFSSKKYKWICSKGHQWKSSVGNRTKNTRGCPYCSNHMACIDNCLATQNPELTKEWHPTRNKGITPYGVLPNSKYKVWWICPNGHEYEAKIYHRNTTSSCPLCSQGIVLQDGTFCHSVAEAYMYLKYKTEGKIFEHNKMYGLGRCKCDFYFPHSNTYTEVTGFLRGRSGTKYGSFYRFYYVQKLER